MSEPLFDLSKEKKVDAGGGATYFPRVSEKIKEDTVYFFTDDFHAYGKSMVAKDFHLPFPSMKFEIKKERKFFEHLSSNFRIFDMKYYAKAQQGYLVSCGKHKYGVVVMFSNDGEILIMEPREDPDGYMVNVLEPFMYQLIYEMFSTIDWINSSEYVVTKHTTRQKTGEHLPKGEIEKRIKIRHISYHTQNYKGTGHGTKHRYKYRVRGHWRNLKETGKKIWIKDQVRGGDGTIFISKEYEL